MLCEARLVPVQGDRGYCGRTLALGTEDDEDKPLTSLAPPSTMSMARLSEPGRAKGKTLRIYGKHGSVYFGT